MHSPRGVPQSGTELQTPASGTQTAEAGLKSKMPFTRVEPRWTISNILSISRVILLIPFVLLILEDGSGSRIAILILMFAAAATDFFDGLIARALNQVTDFGRLLDPAADKICAVTAVVALVLVGEVPLWYAALVALRDILIVIGSALIMSRRKVVVQSVWTGKFTIAFVASYIILAAVRVDALVHVKTFFLYLSTVFLLISFAVYIKVYQKHMAQSGLA
ncbi:MAG: CDP-alcohol phosphatidyltransferase family protein [Candidatus Kryptoniota bacterium]